MRHLAWILGLCALVASVAAVAHRMHGIPSTASVDLLPVWLGAKALWAGQDPNDPAVQQELFRAAELRMRVGGFWSYYPPTAALLWLPSAAAPFKTVATGWRYIALALLVATGWMGSGRLRWGAWIAAALLQLRVSWVVLPSGQPGPLVAAWTAAALLALGLRRDRLAGLCIGLGAAVKLVPLVLVPALIATRRWRSLAVATGVLVVGMAGVLVLAPSWSPSAWASGLLRFVDAPVFEPWRRQEPAWVLALWRARVVGPGVGTLLVCALVFRRRADPAGLPALCVAWAGVVMAGSHHYHEALVILPAVAWALGQGGWLAAGTGLALLVGRTWDPTTPPSVLHWVPVGWAVWGLLAVHVSRELLRPARG